MRICRVLLWVGAALLPAACCQSTLAQSRYEVVTGKAFDSAVPKDFYLEGNAIPTEKRNAVMVKTPGGARAIFALIDTTGYAASVQAKYIGMIITEGDITLCGHKIGVGSYGFGWSLPATGVDAPGKFSLYNQAGASLAECTAERQGDLKMPRPLQVVVESGGKARLYHGKHYIAIE